MIGRAAQAQYLVQCYGKTNGELWKVLVMKNCIVTFGTKQRTHQYINQQLFMGYYTASYALRLEDQIYRSCYILFEL